ncbi:3-oxoacyl-ACP synthase [Streptomyces sp. ISL-96]|uniref:beta-ketoacyl synthase N-terminal-like domain-containing protein n=1 Tax=Streptomyces sp. ISL-96 TaxID=2819191 RepID=UPI001BE55252|nr:beta-ketoacyl synthase N-terminal-like domain-containing protein [Streptomyces sp. ISL-96]MBT2491896.1 3-oxoacyl-ACP synthase [Streptomyces sp. ISL-96]
MIGAALAVTGAGAVLPPPDAGGEEWFDHRERLGPRGYKYLPAAAQYLLAAAREAVEDGGRLDGVPCDRRGAALALNGGFAELFDTMDRQVAVDDGAAALSPATAPYFAVSLLGSRPAAELGLKGFALTLATPRVAALEALEAGSRAVAAGRCDVLLIGAAEHRVPGALTGGCAPGPPDGRSPDGVEAEQGSVALVLEPQAAADARGARVHGTVRARSLFVPPGRPLPGDLIAGALERLGAPPALDVHCVLDDSEFSDRIADAVAAATGTGSLTTTPAGPGSLAPAVRLVRLLTGPPGARLLVAATREGHAALALVRTGSDTPLPPQKREIHSC